MDFESKHIRVFDLENCRKIVLNRPEKGNALTPEMLEDLRALVSQSASDPSISIICFSSQGEHFCSGADLTWMKQSKDLDEKSNFESAQALFLLYETLYQSPKIVVSFVNGACMGGGLGIVACSDIAIAHTSSFFSLSEVRLGLIPATILPFVHQKIGVSAYQFLSTTAHRFDAKEAKRLNLVHEIVKKHVMDIIDPYVEQLLQNSPHAMMAHKKLLRRLYPLPSVDLKKLTSTAIAQRRISADAQEGLSAFLERRKPNWGLVK